MRVSFSPSKALLLDPCIVNSVHMIILGYIRKQILSWRSKGDHTLV